MSRRASTRVSGVRLIAYMPLAAGALTGKYSASARPAGWRIGTDQGDLLFGRRTWQDFITAWGRRPGRQADDNPFTTPMNAATKYVVSRTLEDANAWQNSILLRGDAVDTVAELKAQSGRDLSITGSASLVRTLHAAGLIDRYTLLICPLTLGSGTQLFDGPAPLTEFELTSSLATTKDVIIAHYSRR